MNSNPYPNQQPPSGPYPPNPGYPPQPNGPYTQYPPQGQPGYPPQPMTPPPGYQQPPQQEVKKKKLPIFKIGCGAIVALVVLGIIIGVASGGKDNTGTASTSSTSSTTSSTTSSSSAPQHFKVGDTVKVGDTWQAVVNSVKTDDGGQYSTLKSGDTYLVVDVSLKNLSNQEQDVSSIIQFTLQDATTGKKYDESVDTNAGATLDGKVSAGSPLEGVIAFEVPASVHSFTFNFEANAFGAGQTTWDLSV